MERIHSEAHNRNEILKNVEGLLGYQNMTPAQQRLIRLSLYVQDRAVRTSKLSSYSKSGEVVDAWFCTAAVSAIEQADVLGIETAVEEVFVYSELDESFFEGMEYSEKITDYASLLQFVQDKIDIYSLPLVLDVATATFKGVHGCIILGIDDENNMLIWQKEGVKLPFSVVTLKDVYADYPSGYFWGVRKLIQK